MGVTHLFNTVVYMSSIASLVAIVIMCARVVLKRICPTLFSYVLWAVLLFRLITPISFSSGLSVFNWYPMGTQLQEEPVQVPVAGQNIQDLNVNHLLSQQVTPSTNVGLNLQLIALIWAVVAISLVLICIGLYCWTMYKFNEAIIVQEEAMSIDVVRHLRKQKIKMYHMKSIPTPIISGIIKPRIIIPSEMLDMDNQSILKSVVCHELVHLRRKDHIIKLFTLLVACVHWFNPLVWIALHLAHKDMEESCDEKVIKEASLDIRKEYAHALLSFTLPKNYLSSSIGVAFGESHMKSRIKGILTYKKPSFWITSIGIILILIVAIGMATDASRKVVEVDFESIKVARADSWIEIGDISEGVIQAVIVDRDPNFYEHNGVDPSALFKAAIHNMKTGSLSEGGTTISEQLIRQMIPFDRDKRLERKQMQMYSAIEMERKYSKDEIMEVYLNISPFGRGIEGIKGAAEYYFNKAPKQLTREEAARLIALVEAPTRYDIISNKANNDRKAQEILAKME